MDYILFCANREVTDMRDADWHVNEQHKKLYFTVTFRIKKENFHFPNPVTGFVHISGCGPAGRVKYAVLIEDILPFVREHYEAPGAKAFKPDKWLQEWKTNTNNVQAWNWEYTLVITAIEQLRLQNGFTSERS